MKNYLVLSPVLLLIFNRPEVTVKVFQQIKQVKPKKLYVAADGPRDNKETDLLLCQQTKEIIDQIDWDCELKTLYRDKNLGCKLAVSSAIDWFFNKEEEGIILEDDCLPAISFFYFCDNLLEQYRHDTRIRHIAGCNLQQGNKWGNSTYYFSNLTHVWGWASWKRAWKDYDRDLQRYDNNEVKEQFTKIFADPYVIDSWTEIFKEMKAQKIDTWDYQLAITNFFNNGLNIIPNFNLISNIGFNNNATHTQDAKNPNANIPVIEIHEITHPKYFLPEKQADMYTLKKDFDVDNKQKKDKTLKIKVKRLFKK